MNLSLVMGRQQCSLSMNNDEDWSQADNFRDSKYTSILCTGLKYTFSKILISTPLENGSVLEFRNLNTKVLFPSGKLASSILTKSTEEAFLQVISPHRIQRRHIRTCILTSSQKNGEKTLLSSKMTNSFKI